MKTQATLKFLLEIDKLKKIERKTLVHNGGRYENSAEHSWHLAMAVIIFHSQSPSPVDLLKSLKMALLHDLVEIDAGDTFIYGDLSAKNAEELKAIERLSQILPDELGTELKDIWLEFEKGESAEARFVSGLDRFLPIFSNYHNEGHSWKKHGVTLDKVLEKNQKAIQQALPNLWMTTDAMLKETCQRGNLKEMPAADLK